MVVKIAERFNLKPLDLMSEAFGDSAVKPVRFLSLVDEDGSVSKSNSSSVFTSTATDIAADYIYVMPDETMYKADIIKGDVCLIRATGAIRAGVPMLVKYQGKAMLRFIITHNETNQIALRTASPYAIGTLFSTEDFHDQVQVLGVLVAFRRIIKGGNLLWLSKRTQKEEPGCSTVPVKILPERLSDIVVEVSKQKKKQKKPSLPSVWK